MLYWKCKSQTRKLILCMLIMYRLATSTFRCKDWMVFSIALNIIAVSDSPHIHVYPGFYQYVQDWGSCVLSKDTLMKTLALPLRPEASISNWKVLHFTTETPVTNLKSLSQNCFIVMDSILTLFLKHHFETVPNSQMTTEMWQLVLKDFKIEKL